MRKNRAIHLSTKTPDCLDKILAEVNILFPEEERYKEIQKIEKITGKFLQYREYVKIRIDTEHMTATLQID